MRYFKLEEFECPCCGKADMDDFFLRKIDELRHLCDFPFVITSGFRCKDRNDQVGGSLGSQHLFGRAADIRMAGLNAMKVLESARALGFSGIGIYQNGSSRWIHLDTRPGPFALWSK